MKKLILTCGTLLLAGVAFAQAPQTKQPSKPGMVAPAQNNPAMQPAGEDPMNISPAVEQANEQAEEADAKGPNGELLSPEQRADKWIARVSKAVNLTPDQQQKIRPMILNTIMQKEQIKQQMGGDKAKMAPMVHQINIQRNMMLRQNLTPEQWRKLQQMRKEMRDNSKDKMPVTTPAGK